MSPKPPRSAGAAAQAPGVRLASDGSAGGRRRSWGSALSRLALTLVDPLGLFTRGRRDAAAADEDADVDMDEQLMPGGGGAGAGAGGVGEEDARQAGEWRGLAAGADAALAGAGGGGRGVGGGGEESELSSEEMAAAVGGGVAEGAGGGSSGYEEDDEAGMGEGEEGEGMLEEGGEEEEEDGFEHQEGDEEEEEAEDEEAVAQQEDAVLREEASTLRAARAAAPQPPRRRRPRPGHHAPLGGGVRVGGSRGGATKYPMDVFEDDCCYELQADVPGMCESDLVVAADAHHLTVEGTDLTVTSQARGASRPVQGAAAGVEGGARPPRAVRTERRRRRHFKRTFRLPHDADAAAISASLADGVLVVRLAKARGAAATSAATSAAAARPSDASAVGGGASALGRRRVRVDRLPSARVDPTVIAEATAAAAAMAEHPWPVGIQPPAAAEPAAAAGPTLPAAEAVAVSKLVAPESTAYGGGGVGVSYEAPGGTGGFSTGGDGSGSGGGEGGKEVVAEAGEMGPQSPPSSPPPRPGQAAAAAAKAPPPPATPRQVPLS